MTAPTGDADPGAQSAQATRRTPLHVVSVAVLLVGLAATAALSLIAEVNYDHNENRLLRLRVQDAGALISAAIPTIETPLASATEVAIATGDPASFVSFIRPYVGKGNTVSASLWVSTPGGVHMVASVGRPPDLKNDTAEANQFFGRALASHQVSLIKLGRRSVEHLGFAYSPPGTRYIALEENSVQPNRARIASNNAFANLDYAIYVGHAANPADLLTTDVAHLPFSGRNQSIVVPFGKDAFLLVISPTTSLQGSFSEYLPFLVGVIGVVVSLGAMLLVERLVRRREFAEAIAAALDEVAAQNRRLYDEQRSIADTLQHALLPQALPEIEDAEVSARYVAGAVGIDVGGDWYDVVKIDEHRFLFVVGDVSGNGLRAATVMAELRFATRAYVAEGVAPSEILTKLAHLHSLDTDGHFATVLCAYVDLAKNEMVIANAGHLNPLLQEGAGFRPVVTSVGVPIGVETDQRYESVRVRLPQRGTLLAFTDGLVERRGTHIDVALRRLQEAASSGEEPLAEMLDRILAEFGPDGFDDDAALLGVRWLN